ncbi:ATP-binding protein [Umezawaea endophytica]|uniref:ATP-binding protein n=1 Tax=Umezawaea endophytica TaxID=1654476 RepID=A0A9X2VM35_9PSEU|nr:ATP-binding protein [Umezawaea endophytica]MCS7478522.1 ATP-binding protein [Umezawaea endophytica]
MTTPTTRPQHEFRLDDHETPPLSQVRAWIRTVLADLDPDLVADTELIATELAANAFEHAQAPRVIRLGHDDSDGIVRIEVDDAAPDVLPKPGTSTLGEFRGRGLVLIKSMGAAWGVDRYTDRKTVWAEIPEPTA